MKGCRDASNWKGNEDRLFSFQIVERYVHEKVEHAIRPDVGQDEAPEVPRYETSRGPGSTTEVNYWTS